LAQNCSVWLEQVPPSGCGVAQKVYSVGPSGSRQVVVPVQFEPVEGSQRGKQAPPSVPRVQMQTSPEGQNALLGGKHAAPLATGVAQRPASAARNADRQEVPLVQELLVERGSHRSKQVPLLSPGGRMQVAGGAQSSSSEGLHAWPTVAVAVRQMPSRPPSGAVIAPQTWLLGQAAPIMPVGSQLAAHTEPTFPTWTHEVPCTQGKGVPPSLASVQAPPAAMAGMHCLVDVSQNVEPLQPPQGSLLPQPASAAAKETPTDNANRFKVTSGEGLKLQAPLGPNPVVGRAGGRQWQAFRRTQ
jgi:hypothetical protein